MKFNNHIHINYKILSNNKLKKRKNKIKVLKNNNLKKIL